MAEIEIYTIMFCPYCHRAKHLLDQKGIHYREIDVTSSPELRAAMRARADGRHTVPQIFIDGVGIGGSDELRELEESGELDALLSGTNGS
jgi:glutaredoxin 3